MLVSLTNYFFQCIITPGNRSTCTPPVDYKPPSFPVPVDYLTRINSLEATRGEFISLLYILLKIGECHMLR